MLITSGCHAIRTGAIFTSLTVGLRGTGRRFIFGRTAYTKLTQTIGAIHYVIVVVLQFYPCGGARVKR